MEDSDKPVNINEAARAALLAFLRRVFSQLANEHQRDSLAYRAQLEKLK